MGLLNHSQLAQLGDKRTPPPEKLKSGDIPNLAAVLSDELPEKQRLPGSIHHLFQYEKEELIEYLTSDLFVLRSLRPFTLSTARQ